MSENDRRQPTEFDRMRAAAIDSPGVWIKRNGLAMRVVAGPPLSPEWMKRLMEDK